jgi:hypothetical protein
MPLPKKITSRKINLPSGPVWQGPNGKGPQGGITNSLLTKYLQCKERFRVYAIDGWKMPDKFNASLEYGSMWHIREEGLAAVQKGKAADWFKEHGITNYAQELMTKFPMDQEEIAVWYGKCQALFPCYINHWEEHPDVKDRKPLLQEESFDFLYHLPSSRSVRLRGKWDSVDLIGDGVYLQENKTKSGIDERKIVGQLKFDLQTMLYLIALQEDCHPEIGDNVAELAGAKIGGVRYNVVRRPLHKSVESAMKKFHEDREAGRVGEWFARWKVDVTPQEIRWFRTSCLDPVLENLLDDYEWWEHCYNIRDMQFAYDLRQKRFPNHISRHFRMPYFYNPIAEGGQSDIDHHLADGSIVGLKRVEDLFPELAQEVK